MTRKHQHVGLIHRQVAREMPDRPINVRVIENLLVQPGTKVMCPVANLGGKVHKPSFGEVHAQRDELFCWHSVSEM